MAIKEGLLKKIKESVDRAYEGDTSMKADCFEHGHIGDLLDYAEEIEKDLIAAQKELAALHKP